MHSPASEPAPVLRLLLLLAARRRFVLWTVFSTALVTAVISLVMNKTFESTAVISPPSGSSGMLGGLIGSLPMGDMLGGLSGSLGEGAGGEYFVALLNSRQMHEGLITEFKLREHYKMPRAKIEDVLKRVGRNVGAGLDFESGMIHLAVRDKDPQVAFKMAQWCIARLESLNLELKTRKARLSREFAEKEVRIIRSELDSLEREMLRFQKGSRMLEPEAQGEAILAKYAEIKAQEAVKDLELKMARQNFGPRHPTVMRAEQELAAIREELKDSWERGDSDLFLAINQLPVATMDYLRRQRELEIANKKLIFMLPQLEQAKLDEVNDNPVLEVLDPPRLAEKKIKPKRSLMVLGAAFAAFLAAALVVVFQDRLERDEVFSGQVGELVRRALGRRA